MKTRPFFSVFCLIFSDRQRPNESQLLTKYVHENLRGKYNARFPNRWPLCVSMGLTFVPYIPNYHQCTPAFVSNWLEIVPENPLLDIQKQGETFLTLPAVVPGFEPGQTEPKPVVLPLHHTTIAL